MSPRVRFMKISLGIIILVVCIWNFHTLVTLIPECTLQSNPVRQESNVEKNLTLEEFYMSPGFRESLKAIIQVSSSQLTEVFTKVSKIEFDQTWNFTRAIMAFLPANSSHFNAELKHFYLSLAYVRSLQPKNVKTDLLVFTPPNTDRFLEEIGCTNQLRASFLDEERCTIINHLPLEERLNSEDAYPDSLISYARYVNSMLILAEFQFADRYDFILRSDLDCFIAPGMADWIPPNYSTLMTGQGGYGSKNAELHLKYVSKQLNLNYNEMGGLGSTWYGNAELMVATANLTISVMRWLTTQEFSAFEKCCSGVESWPHWHWPVILLYGGHIALNHLGPSGIVQSNQSYPQLDHQSTRQTEMTNEVKHIHCWHTADLFSKFKFSSGQYKNLSLEEYKEMKTPSHYSTVVAVSSSRLSSLEFKELVANITAMRETQWIRYDPVP